jgi:hypothetical protein
MAAILISAVVTCLASLFIGQAALRLCGAREWSWLAPPVGLAVVMLIASPTFDIPGRASTMTVLVGALTVAATVWCLLEPEHRPPLGGLWAAVPVVALVLIPFLSSDHAGIIGVTVDNDMAAHMVFVENYLSSAAAALKPALFDLYPVGPHTSVALIAKGLDIRVDHAFAGWTMALPVLNAWAALALVRRAAWLKQALTVTVVAMPFLVAAYYGQGSFKELSQTGFVFATVLLFSGYGPSLGRGRWVPVALLAGGMVSVYSVTGLSWPIVIGGLCLLGIVVQRVVRGGRRNLAATARGLLAAVRGELPALGIGLGVLVASLLPQASRIHNFIAANSGTNGIIVPKDVLGNLVGPLPGWEAFGVWNTPDYRLPAAPAFTAGMWTAFVVALALFGVLWTLRRGRWMLPLAAAGSMLIWAVSIRSQSPYVVAKALVIASPLLLTLAVLPLVEQLPDRFPRSFSSLFRKVPGQPMSWGLAAILAVVLFVRVGNSDVQALRFSPIGPTDHAEQLRDLRPLLHNQPTLFLGNDDFIRWELAGVPVGAPIFGGLIETPLREEKKWTPDVALDFDVVDAATLNSYDWVITTRDAAGSEPPPQMHLVRATQSFDLWHRVGEVRERRTLAEGGMPGATLDCRTPEGRAVLRGGGVAAVRPRPVEAAGTLLPAGGNATVEIPLTPGRWKLESTYLSRYPVEVTAPGLDVTMPPSLDRPGPRWPIGSVTVRGTQPTALTFRIGDPLLAPNTPVADLGTIVATRDRPERIVPISQACGRYVDWYRSDPSPDRGSS